LRKIKGRPPQRDQRPREADGEDREAPVAALGKVTATQDIFGPRMEALNAEAAAAVSEKKALLTQNEDVYAQAEELDIWLENNTEGRWKRVTISATVTSA
jgi:hypothetical protein